MAPAKNIAPKNAFLTTAEWLEKIKKELEFLEWERKRQIAERLKEAISYWDLSENSEYAEAKEEQAFNETKIAEVKRNIQNAFIISDDKWNWINLWSEVEVENLTSWEKDTFKIVWTTEIDPFNWKISNEWELWKALIWKKKWDGFSIETHHWEVKYKVISFK